MSVIKAPVGIEREVIDDLDSDKPYAVREIYRPYVEVPEPVAQVVDLAKTGLTIVGGLARVGKYLLLEAVR